MREASLARLGYCTVLDGKPSSRRARTEHSELRSEAGVARDARTSTGHSQHTLSSYRASRRLSCVASKFKTVRYSSTFHVWLRLRFTFGGAPHYNGRRRLEANGERWHAASRPRGSALHLRLPALSSVVDDFHFRRPRSAREFACRPTASQSPRHGRR